MYIRDQWYLACVMDELENTNPLSKKILGEEIVIFKNTSGNIAAIENRCCHRNVNLSLGCVKGENIQCGYHGWEYNSDGKCVFIPSLDPGDRIPPQARVKSYSTVVRHKSVWIWIGQEELKNPSLIPPMHEMDVYPMVFNYHFIKADLQLVAESLFDAYHINHVHRNSIKGMMGALKTDMEGLQVDVTEWSLTGKYWRDNDRSIFERIYFGGGKKVETHFGFWFPNISKLDIRLRDRHMVIYEHFYQVDEETVCMMQITLWKNILDLFPPFARWFMHRKSLRIVGEDLVFLENNKRVKAGSGKSDLLITSDRVTIEFMKLWKRNMSNEKVAGEKDTSQAQRI